MYLFIPENIAKGEADLHTNSGTKNPWAHLNFKTGIITQGIYSAKLPTTIT